MEICFDYLFEPRFSDFDSYAIAHHSKYFCWFEEARFYFLRNILKMSNEDISDIRCPLINLSCEFKKLITYGEAYIISSQIIFDMEIAKIKFVYQIYNNDKTVRFANGVTEHVFLSSEGKLLFKMPNKLILRLNDLVK